MGSNGQQVVAYLPSGTGKVRFSGTNQNNEPRLFDTNAVNESITGHNPNNIFTAVAGINWWWKGHLDIWYNDSAGTTHHVVANVPVSYNDDNYRLAIGVDPGAVSQLIGGSKVIKVHG